METMKEKSFNDLVEQFLGTRLPQQMAEAVSMSELHPEAQGFVMRLLALMKRSGYSVTNFNSHLIRWISTTVPAFLPNAWGGRIPPLTIPGRHKKFDRYVAGQNRTPGSEPHIFVDVGCGFPPVTSAETARKLPEWQIYGIDRSFADYVLYDLNGHYACFDQKDGFQYFQASMHPSGRALYTDPAGTKNNFNKLFAELAPLLPKSNGAKSETVEKDGRKLIHNHIRDFETDNLTFIKSDLEELNIQPAKVIRCMNVMIYFKPEKRKEMLLKAGEILDDDGIMIVGTNGFGTQSRYAIYQKGANGMFPSEYSFSPDNLGNIVFMPWLTMQENDPEATLLADLSATIRADRSFWPDFSNRMDELLQEGGICRDSDGFFHFPEEMTPIEVMNKFAVLWQQMDKEGYTDSAVEVLGRAGYDAWKNPVGDIAVRPPANSLPLC